MAAFIAIVGALLALHTGSAAAGDDCAAPTPATFTVFLPKLDQPPDHEGQGWSRPNVWPGHANAGDDWIEVPNGRRVYALFVSGYRQNADFDNLIFYDFARHLMTENLVNGVADAYVHYAWWNNLLAPYMERPLHSGQSHPGSGELADFTTPAEAAGKAVPGEDYQFVADAKRLLSAIREHNPSAMIIVAGHSMGGAAVVHLAAELADADVVIDILAPIDPVGNRNYPWAGPLFNGAEHYNWTRWRASRNNFLGYQDRRVDPEHPFQGCQAWDPWRANIADVEVGQFCALEGPVIHDAPTLRFGSYVINLHHRFQTEARFPFDFAAEEHFLHTMPPGGSSSQLRTTTRSSGSDVGGWPSTNQPGGGECCPVGSGVAFPADGHGEIVGFRGPVTLTEQPRPLATRVRTSPDCSGCPGLTWPERASSGGVWLDPDPNAASRVDKLTALETLPGGRTWEHEPYNPDLCLVSPGLILKYESMNKPPQASAGPDQVVACDGCTTALVTLSGSGSTDPDEDSLTYSWTWAFGDASGQTVQVQLPVGTNCVTLEVEDPSGHISRDTVAVRVSDPAAAVVPYTSAATAWQTDVGSHEARAFDEFFPGIANDTGCVLTPPLQPAVLQLTGGQMTVSALSGTSASCAITDSATTPAVSDGHISSGNSVARMEFDPPVSEFYTYYGSLGIGQTATMSLFADGGATPFTSLTTPPSTHASLAAGQGFTSTIPVRAIEFSSTENGIVLVGAYVGLRTGEQSLGTVDLGSYPGPGPSGVIQLDFALAFVDTCPADWDESGTVNSSDISAFLTSWLDSVQNGNLNADFNDDGAVNSNDISGFLTAWLDAVQNGC